MSTIWEIFFCFCAWPLEAIITQKTNEGHYFIFILYVNTTSRLEYTVLQIASPCGCCITVLFVVFLPLFYPGESAGKTVHLRMTMLTHCTFSMKELCSPPKMFILI